jgi:dGTPase
MRDKACTYRQVRENLENTMLSEYATKSRDSLGRERDIEPCDMRTAFQRDRDRILHCKSFRRLKHKTQVFLSPEGDHYRTRLTHTLEVSQIARTIARSLRLNEDLAEAIAFGHDLGHTPFGHAGERVLNELTGHFEHNEQSLRVVEVLEDGCGLNLTFEVRDGILKHKKSLEPATLEGMVVRVSDMVAYVNHDIDDALRANIISEIPSEFLDAFGSTHGERINTMITDIVVNSDGKAGIYMSEDVQTLFEKLRAFMFENVYFGSAAKREEGKAEHLIRLLFNYFYENPSEMKQDAELKKYGLLQTVADYIAGMTDRYAVKVFEDIYIPKGWKKY